MSNHNRKTNRFLLLVLLITAAFLSAGASSWLIINENSNSPLFQANTPIAASVKIDGTSYEGEKTLVGTANMPGVFKYNNATIGTLSTAGGTCEITAPKDLTGNSELISFTATFVPNSTWLADNHYEISNPAALSSITANVKGVAKVGTTYYSNIDLAIDATDNAASGTTIYVSESFSDYLSVSGVTASAAELEKYRKLSALTIRQANQTLGSNAILTIPYDDTYALNDTTTLLKSSTEVYDVSKYYNNLQYNVSVSASNTFINEGTINICAVVGGGQGEATSSLVAGNHGRLTLFNNSRVTNKSKIYCYGYIDEINAQASGELENLNGAYLESLFTITDHRGGNAYMKLVNIGLTQPYDFKSCPFNRFHMGNITPKMIVNYNAQVLGCAVLNMSDSPNKAIIKLAGSDSTYILQIPSGSKFIADYNKSTNIAKWDIYGNATLNQLVTELTLIGFAAKVTTAGILFPITWQYEYHLHPYENGNSSSVTLNQDIKIMPGGSLTVEEGVSLTANNLIVYDENFVSDTAKNCAPLKYSNPLEATRPGGELVVNGAMTVGKLGGTVISKNSGAKLSITSQASTTSHEITGSTTSATITADWTQTAQGDIYGTDLTDLELATYYSIESSDGVYEWFREDQEFNISYVHKMDDEVTDLTAEQLASITNNNATKYAMATNSSITNPKSTIDGFVCAGLYVKNSSNELVRITGIVGETMFSYYGGNAEIYVLWTQAQTFTISYTSEQYSTEFTKTVEGVIEGSTFALASDISSNITKHDRDITKQYYFDKWLYTYTAEDGTNVTNSETAPTKVLSDITVTAKWKQKIKVDVTLTQDSSHSASNSTVIKVNGTQAYANTETSSTTTYFWVMANDVIETTASRKERSIYTSNVEISDGINANATDSADWGGTATATQKTTAKDTMTSIKITITLS